MSRFLQVILPLLALVSLSEALGQVRQLQMRDAQIYLSAPDNFAIRAPELAQIGWKTVSVNNGNVVAIQANCQQVQKTSASLTAQESSMLLSRKTQLQSFFSGQSMQMPSGGYSSASFDLGNAQQQGLQSTKTSFSFIDENNFSITRPNLPNNLARVAIYGDTVVFFTRDLQIHMKPVNCLQPTEQQLVQQLKTEARQAAQQMNQQMQQHQQQFQQSMNQFQQQMQQFGQQMQQQLPSWMPWASQGGFFGANNYNQGQNGFPSQNGGFNQVQRPGWQQNSARPQAPSFPGAGLLNFMSPSAQSYPQQGQYGVRAGAQTGMGGMGGWASAGLNGPIGGGLSFSF